MTKLPNDAFLRTYPRRQAIHDCIDSLTGVIKILNSKIPKFDKLKITVF